MHWRTKPVKGGIKVVTEDGAPVSEAEIADVSAGNLKDAEDNLKARLLKRP